MKGDNVTMLINKVWIGESDQFWVDVKIFESLPGQFVHKHIHIGIDDIDEKIIALATGQKIILDVGLLDDKFLTVYIIVRRSVLFHAAK